nr:ABC transporter permease [Mycobacterium lehmannii]
MTETWLHAGRLLIRWRRERAVLLGSLLVPIGLLVLYEVVLGDSVQRLTGTRSVYGLVPICAVLSALFGSLGNAASIALDREAGLLGRIYVLPIHRVSPLTGRFFAEAVRALIGTILITGLGLIMGLRFTHGWGAALIFVLIPSIVVIGFTALVLALASRRNGRQLMTWLVSATVALAFINPGFTPIETFPDWVQPFVRMQPMSPPVEAMRSLALGGPLAWPLTMTLVWAVVLLALFIPLAVRGFRLAAESGTS